MLNSQVNKKLNCVRRILMTPSVKNQINPGEHWEGLYRVIRGVAVTNKIN